MNTCYCFHIVTWSTPARGSPNTKWAVMMHLQPWPGLVEDTFRNFPSVLFGHEHHICLVPQLNVILQDCLPCIPLNTLPLTFIRRIPFTEFSFSIFSTWTPQMPSAHKDQDFSGTFPTWCCGVVLLRCRVVVVVWLGLQKADWQGQRSFPLPPISSFPHLSVVQCNTSHAL